MPAAISPAKAQIGSDAQSKANDAASQIDFMASAPFVQRFSGACSER
jgi:hypothetical protein